MVKSILLIRTHKKKSQKLQTTAIIDMKDSSHRKLVVHNLDFFLNDLENHQSELVFFYNFFSI